ncbi:hypothetical protein [Chitinophaga sp. LS1]|uniref:hypothetical protein n=1 Tax=Chitinophaga sp. LS1 TaxID=3051176 RepID=UPI002AAA7638|nr:hypothetical protein [Chitinophaga sp. LS1]WPV67749.1 hypothetical protein QQL36_03285 [Chitinophaga sp. LS1]
MIPVFVINLPHRQDKRLNIIHEFSDKNIFKTSIVAPIPHEIGAVSLWFTIQHIIQNLTPDGAL